MTYLIEASRIERVVCLTQLLLRGEAVDTAQAAQTFEVSRRTIQRDLAEMSRVLPIYSDGGRWMVITEQISPY